MSDTPTAPAAPPLTKALPLVMYPAPVLRRIATPVKHFDNELAQLCAGMLATMEQHRGVGLAAPQVGVSRRIFVTNHVGSGPEHAAHQRVWINPVITSASGEHLHEEGCLSIPGCYAQLRRPAKINITWQDLRGEHHNATFDAEVGDFLAVITQHELDHLDGRLFLDHLGSAQLTLLRRRLRELEKDYKQATGTAGAVLRR